MREEFRKTFNQIPDRFWMATEGNRYPYTFIIDRGYWNEKYIYDGIEGKWYRINFYRRDEYLKNGNYKEITEEEFLLAIL